MKAIQITFDEELLARLDASEDVKRDGRSAVLRRAAAEYLARRTRHSIAERYRNAYGSVDTPDHEFAGWENEGRWPDE